MKLKTSIGGKVLDKSLNRDSYELIFQKLKNSPFGFTWQKMELLSNHLIEEQYDYEKIIKEIKSKKTDSIVNVYGNEIDFGIARNKNHVVVAFNMDSNLVNNHHIEDIKKYFYDLIFSIDNFEGLDSDTSISKNDFFKEKQIPEEKSIFSNISWLNIVSPLDYEGYYEKADLLAAPFYKVEEIAPDIIMIQAYRDPFDFDNEESINYLKNGINYLNEHIVYLKK